MLVCSLVQSDINNTSCETGILSKLLRLEPLERAVKITKLMTIQLLHLFYHIFCSIGRKCFSSLSLCRINSLCCAVSYFSQLNHVQENVAKATSECRSTEETKPYMFTPLHRVSKVAGKVFHFSDCFKYMCGRRKITAVPLCSSLPSLALFRVIHTLHFCFIQPKQGESIDLSAILSLQVLLHYCFFTLGRQLAVQVLSSAKFLQ